MRPEDFFIEADEDVFGVSFATPKLRRDLLRELRAGPVEEVGDAEAGVGLARLVHDELEVFGTSGNPQLNEHEIREALQAFRAVAKRLGVEVDVPFRDYATFKSYWLRNDGYGSWQARRDMLSEIFDKAHDELIELESGALTSSLVTSVSPRGRTGWARVDEEITELRRHFQSARTPQDYRNVGNDCVTVLEAISAVVFDLNQHLEDGEEEPPVAKTKLRIERFVEHEMTGRESASLRKLARASIEFAQELKHTQASSRRDAGISADAVIQLANLLRRISDDRGKD